MSNIELGRKCVLLRLFARTTHKIAEIVLWYYYYYYYYHLLVINTQATINGRGPTITGFPKQTLPKVVTSSFGRLVTCLGFRRRFGIRAPRALYCHNATSTISKQPFIRHTIAYEYYFIFIHSLKLFT